MPKIILNIASAKSVALMEVLIAFFILGISATAATTMIHQASQISLFARHELTATNLAREGVEAVRNIIETNWLRCPTTKSISWLLLDSRSSCDLASSFTNGFLYAIDLDPSNAFDWKINPSDSTSGPVSPTDASYQINVDTDGYYVHGAGTTTPFFRQIETDLTDSDPTDTDPYDGITATVTVSWYEKSRLSNVTLVSSVSNF